MAESKKYVVTNELFEEMYEENLNHVMFLLRKNGAKAMVYEYAQEIMQDCWTRHFQNLPLEADRNPAAFISFMVTRETGNWSRINLAKCRDIFRSTSIEGMTTDNDETQAFEAVDRREDSPFEALVKTEMWETVKKALDERENTVIMAKVVDGRTFKDIAEELETDVKTVTKIYKGAIEKLRISLRDYAN